MKVVIVGCTHAGTAAAVSIARQHKADITIYERNDNVSFLSCGIALHVGEVVKDLSSLFYSSPDKLKSLGVNTCMKHEVQSVDVKGKKLTVKNLQTDEVFEDSYDKLVVTTGSWPIVPRFPGVDLKNVLLCKNFDHAKQIVQSAKNAKNVAVVGAGYIGVELVEAFSDTGKNVTVIDMETRVMSKYMDKEFTDKAEELFKAKGVKMALGEAVKELKGADGTVTSVVTDKGEHTADLVILCIGFMPNTSLFKDQLEMLKNGAIVVDEYMHTSDKDVLAAGDSATIFYNPTQTHSYIPLATNAVRMGTLVGYNLVENKLKYIGTQSTSGIRIFGLNMAGTGLTEAAAAANNIQVKTVTVTENNRPEFMPDFNEILLKIVYRADNGIIVGAQLCSTGDYTQIINTLSVCLQNKMTMAEIAMVDQFFQPHFNKPWGIINTAGLMAIE